MIEGRVYSEMDNEALPYCYVYLDNQKYATQTDEQGYFRIGPLPYGDYTLSFQYLGYELKTEQVQLSQPKIMLSIRMTNKAQQLDPVNVEAEKDGLGALQRMRAIEGVFICEGKKNEVIQLSAIHANKAVNPGRQIYSRIPGLNIWESDGSGIQLGIGGRGLSPNRTSNFNTRQNGYDISADALGYPESYYTPPAEALKEIQLIRGAASLQFGTQFGGLLNFMIKDGPEDKELEAIARHTVGSFNLHSSFLSLGWNKKGWKGYSYFQRKTGEEWRPNSRFRLYSGGIHSTKEISKKAVWIVEYTKQYYLAKQPGGLTDREFIEDPYRSNRARNWFEVDWNLAATSLQYDLSSLSTLKTQFFGLLAHRHALGILGNISRPDNPNEQRDLISGKFKNWGNETRFLHRYMVRDKIWALLLGARYYQGYNLSSQGDADTTAAANFVYVDEENSRYEFPSRNMALFGENIFRINNRFSITPGARLEYIHTRAEGRYPEEITDLAGNVVFDTTFFETRQNERSFLIGGIGLKYKWHPEMDVYANFSQNYRSINFTDMQIQNSNFRIDPELKDETGFNVDAGLRGSISRKLNYDISGFVLSYDNRIGEIDRVDENTLIPYRYRTNVARAIIKGIETIVEFDWWRTFIADSSHFSLSTFINGSYIDGRYVDSDKPAIEGKKVESVPPLNVKAGLNFSYKNFSISYQYSYVSEHFSDATNAGKDIHGNMIYIPNAIVGVIPAYHIMDVGMKLTIKRFQLEAGINNIGNKVYFTRRATGYPGPGIIPSPIRNYYVTLQLKI